jgi:hypothetical protein
MVVALGTLQRLQTIGSVATGFRISRYLGTDAIVSYEPT